jgi:hypothetical protein
MPNLGAASARTLGWCRGTRANHHGQREAGARSLAMIFVSSHMKPAPVEFLWPRDQMLWYLVCGPSFFNLRAGLKACIGHKSRWIGERSAWSAATFWVLLE